MSEATDSLEPTFISVGTGEAERPIAMRLRPARKGVKGATFVWLSGYRSDMSGSKAQEVDALAERLGLGCIRLDYSGHGIS
ncbi:MAG: alpha/beta hydrolase, partial [Rhizobiaceae bacterium]|nr:alpha/beta hydrolase [Rhizobiaceae bacterium]